MSKRLTLLTIGAMACAATLVLGAPGASAQKLADKPIRILVPIAAGGATDLTARFVAQKLTQSLKLQVFVENKPGGAYIPVLKDLTESAADGHTILMISTAMTVTQPMHPDYPFDLAKLTPITEVSNGPIILVVRPGLGIKTAKELVAYANANPDKLTFGSGGGTGGTFSVATELLKLRTGIKVKNLAYRGAALALNDLLGGHIDAMFDAMPVQVEQAKAGKVVPVLVTSAKRSSALPDVPTSAEAGIADFEVTNYFALLGPPGMPAAITKQLRDEVAKAVGSPDAVEQFEKQGVSAIAGEPAALGVLIKSDLARWSKVIKEAGIKPE
jgi:tripartite-type tricarboxylate transporter receptor subunit TctC